MIAVGRRCSIAYASASLQVLLFSCLLLSGSYAAFLLATISAQTATASLKAASMAIAIAAACAAALKFCTNFVATAKKIKSDVVAAHPLKMKVGKSGLALILVVLYWADVVTDLVLMRELLRTGNPIWGTLTAIFVASSYLLAYAAVLRYLHSRFGFRDWPLWAFAVFGIVPVPLPFVPLAPLPGLPIGPLLLDMLMFVEAFPWVLHRLPSELQTFLSSYRASRKLIEVNAEATPQSVLQTYIFVRVSSFHANTNSFSVPVRLLVQSLSLSILNLGMVAWDVRSAMQISQLGLSAFLAQQFALGAGLPLDALRNNAIEAWKSPFELDLSQIKMLASALNENASLTSLKLDNNALTGCGEAMGEALKVNSALKILEMQNCFFNADDGKGLSSGLAVNASLTQLNLSDNQLCGVWYNYTNQSLQGTFDATGIKAIADALSVNASLTEIYLGGNSLGDAGTESIATALKESTTSKLQKLGMWQNGIGPNGATALAAYMAVSTSLTQLDLSQNQLCGMSFNYIYREWEGIYTAEGINAIADALRVNASLTALYLRANGLDAEAAKALAPAIAGSASLTHIDLQTNFRLGEEGKAAIQAAVRGKTGFKLEM